MKSTNDGKITGKEPSLFSNEDSELALSVESVTKPA